MSKLVDTPLGRFKVHAEGTITRALEAGQWWDDHLRGILDELNRLPYRPGYALDIGAHFGWFSVYLAQQRPVIAVEPFPSSFALLQHNVGMAYRPVQCWPIAAYDWVTTLEFAAGNDPTDAGSFGFTPARAGLVTLHVPAVPLDLYLPADRWVAVIKCDAQGADLRALKGCELTIRRCSPLILFEWEAAMAAWQGDTWQEYLDFFERLNYTVERVCPDYWDYVARPR